LSGTHVTFTIITYVRLYAWVSSK